MVHHRGRLEESETCGFDGFACIIMFFILIYVLYKSRSLTLVTMIYSWDVL